MSEARPEAKSAAQSGAESAAETEAGSERSPAVPDEETPVPSGPAMWRASSPAERVEFVLYYVVAAAVLALVFLFDTPLARYDLAFVGLAVAAWFARRGWIAAKEVSAAAAGRAWIVAGFMAFALVADLVVAGGLVVWIVAALRE